jgi:hypothetical protein
LEFESEFVSATESEIESDLDMATQMSDPSTRTEKSMEKPITLGS